MTPALVFFLAAAVLLALVLAILLPPLLRRTASPPHRHDRRAANLSIFRDQLAELDRDRAAGTLGPAEFEQARDELQHRLLEETEEDAGKASPPAPATRGRSPRTALSLLFALPLAAAVGYALLGQPQALDPMHTQARMSPQEIEGLLDKLQARLKANPEDSQGWVTLARSYKALGRYAEAAEAYSHGGRLVDNDAALLLDYADVLAQLNDGRFAGRPEQLIARALSLDPEEPQALFLAGAAAGEREDYAAVVRHWERLLPLLPAGSEEAKAIDGALLRARELTADKGRPAKAKAPSRTAVSGELLLSGKLAAQARPEDTVFIYARASEGSRMPLAVVRIRVADLPYRFELDDGASLPGGQKLSEHTSFVIEARIARSGQAQIASGDLFGVLTGVTPGRRNLRLIIDRVQP